MASQRLPQLRSARLLAAIPAFAALKEPLRDKIARTMRVETITRRQPFTLRVPPETHYLLPLSHNLTLHRSGALDFGIRLPKGVMWPVRLAPNETMAVRCNAEGMIGLLSEEMIQLLMQQSAETRLALLKSICESNQYATAQLEQYACNDLTGRVARLLLDLAQASPNGVIHYPHSQLAALLNAQRESVSIIIGRFRRANWVETSYGRIRVIDYAALQRLAQQY